MLLTLIRETFSFAIILPSLVFLSLSAFIFFRDGYSSDRILQRLLCCVGLSPLCYILGCRLLAGAVIDLIRLIGLKNETVFLFIRTAFPAFRS